MIDGEAIERGGDAAAKAFDQLRGEVAILRMATERLATEKTEIELPDYTATLAQMAAGIQTTAEHIAELKSQPMLQMTAQTLSWQITRAGEQVRRADHDTIVGASSKLDRAIGDLRFWVASAREARRQDLQVVIAGVGGLVVGAILWATIPGAVARIAPASWGWPEKMAAKAMGDNLWQAGERMMMVGDPDRWQALVTAARSTAKSSKSDADK